MRYVGSVMQLADAGRGVVQLRLRRDMGKTLCVVWTILQLLVWLLQFDAWTKNCQTRIARSVSNIPCKMQKVDTSQQFNCNMYSMLMHIHAYTHVLLWERRLAFTAHFLAGIMWSHPGSHFEDQWLRLQQLDYFLMILAVFWLLSSLIFVWTTGDRCVRGVFGMQ